MRILACLAVLVVSTSVLWANDQQDPSSLVDHGTSESEIASGVYELEFVESEVFEFDSNGSEPNRLDADSPQSIELFSKVNQLQFAVNTGYKLGYFTYQIGGAVSDGTSVGIVHFPLSELRFPLSVSTVRGEFVLRMRNGWRGKLSLEKNTSDQTGHMEDSDWGVAEYIVPGSGIDPDSLDVFSRSRSDVSLKEFSLIVNKSYGEYRDPLNLANWHTLMGAGLTYQEYYFNVYDLVQSYPSLDLPDSIVDGKVLTYQFKQYTPFISASFKSGEGQMLSLAFDFMLSPRAFIFDDDNHILRDKISSGETKGFSGSAAVELSTRLAAALEVFASFSYQYTKADGWQNQTNTDEGVVTKAKVKLKHFHSQKNIRLGGRLIF